MHRSRLLTLAALVAVGLACAPRLTNYRRGWSNCTVANDNTISCTGRAVAQVECFQPSGESCAALAVRYADGQRVMLTGTVNFPDDQPPQVEADDEYAIKPEISQDARELWFNRAGVGPRAGWKIYVPETGEIQNVDRTHILMMQQRLLSWMPLWRAPVASVAQHN